MGAHEGAQHPIHDVAPTEGAHPPARPSLQGARQAAGSRQQVNQVLPWQLLVRLDKGNGPPLRFAIKRESSGEHILIVFCKFGTPNVDHFQKCFWMGVLWGVGKGPAKADCKSGVDLVLGWKRYPRGSHLTFFVLLNPHMNANNFGCAKNFGEPFSINGKMPSTLGGSAQN